MKYLLPFIVFLLLGSVSCNDMQTITYTVDSVKVSAKVPVVKKPEFHIKVVCWGKPSYMSDWKQSYCIHFTNDNWQTKYEVMDALEFVVAFQVDIFYTQDEAINVAKRLKTFEDCVKYNEWVYAKYLKYKERGDKEQSIRDEKERKEKERTDKIVSSQKCSEVIIK